jgi:AAA family ATPase
MSTFLVRPSNTEKEAFRAKLTATSLLSLKLKPGDLCTIRQEDGLGQDVGRPKYAIAWENSGSGMKDNIVQTSKFLQELHSLKLGDKVVIERANETMVDANVVQLRPKNSVELTKRRREFWEHFAELTVGSTYDYVAETQKLSFKVGPDLQEFEVADPGAGGVGIGRITADTSFSIGGTTPSLKPRTAIGGLRAQVLKLQKICERLLKPRITAATGPFQGVLLYGSKGVGKSLLIDHLASATWETVVRWKPGTKTPSFKGSCLVIVGQSDLSSAQTGLKPAIRELEDLFRAAKGKPCLIVGEARHPNDVDSRLRSRGTFSIELEIPIPSAKQRQLILLALRGELSQPDDATIEMMAQKTHGYVGADLGALLRTTLELASERTPGDATGTMPATEPISDETPAFDLAFTDAPEEGPRQDWTVTAEDVSQALTEIRPTALQEIFLETPSTRWDDIGGQHTTKQLLSNAVTRPIQLADKMAKFNLRPKKGVLLYGPPGCSKTLLVRALANEAGLNFLAVKGAELISMYVGESERATREIFSKARAASPSIIFFDEIDAIATRSRSGSDLNVLTTLLNEMDGFEDLRSVFIVAATNKPESIDPALMRPGRFDNVVYIPPPDLEARKEIFTKQFSLSSYQSTQRGVEDDVWYFAEKTAGFSGAECVGICQAAAELALDTDRDFYRFQDVEEAIRTTPRSITPEMLAGFESWNEARMR